MPSSETDPQKKYRKGRRGGHLNPQALRSDLDRLKGMALNVASGEE
jgi:hypothetical protein